MKLFPIATALLIIGTGLSALFILLFFHWRRVKNWDQVPGRVTRTGYKEGMMIQVVMLTTYTPTVEYEYEYAGIKYTGSKITQLDRRLASVEKEKARAILDKIGQTPTVWVDPNRPNNSYLTNKIGWPVLNYLLTYTIIGMLLILVAVGLFYLSSALSR